MKWYDYLLIAAVLAGLLFFAFRLGNFYGRLTVYSHWVEGL